MEFTPEQLEKLGNVSNEKTKRFKSEGKKLDEKELKKLKASNQKKVAQKLNAEELTTVLELLAEAKEKEVDKVLIVSLDYVGEHKENCISVEGNLFYFYQYLFYDGYQMRPIFNGEGLMVILKNKREFTKKSHGKAK
jgi:hypothetical protein